MGQLKRVRVERFDEVSQIYEVDSGIGVHVEKDGGLVLTRKGVAFGFISPSSWSAVFYEEVEDQAKC